ncbi:hypothetical protein [Paludibaculum fermentans]|uniref:hypothetical protein n=1 Tax=Paludibaculum fermentans TaxID=1473598 RepID=UPI003EB8554C
MPSEALGAAAGESGNEADQIGWLKWLVPDFRTMAALALVLYCTVITSAARLFFSDADAGWHIRAGDWIRLNSAVPRDDWFSFVQVGHPWYAWEWLAEIGMSFVHQAAGLPGIAAVSIGVIACGAWLWMHFQRRLGGSILVATPLAALLVLCTRVHWLARPHLISWIFVLLLLIFVESARPPFRVRHFVVLALGTALWTNIHASFFLAFLIPVVVAAALAAQRWILPAQAAPGVGARIRLLLYAAGAALAGSFLNPYGFAVHSHVVAFLATVGSTPIVSEYERPDLFRPGMFLFALTAILSAVGFLWSLVQRRWDRAALAALFLAMGLQTNRGIPLMALGSLPYFNAALSDWWRNRRNAAPWPSLQAVTALEPLLNGAALLPLAALFLVYWAGLPSTRRQASFQPPVYATEALPSVDRLPLSARIYTTDLQAGLLMYVYSGRRKVYLDSRIDYFGPDLCREGIRFWRAESTWPETLKKYRFTHALLDRKAPILTQLRSLGWSELYQDQNFVLLANPTPE